MSDATAIREVLARVESATGPNRETDCWLRQVFDPQYVVLMEPSLPTYGPLSAFDLTGWDDWEAVAATIDAERYTASIDTAVALCERMLPGVFYVIAKGKTRRDEPPFGCQLLFGANTVLGEAESQTAPLAIVAATLRALIAQSERDSADDGGAVT